MKVSSDCTNDPETNVAAASVLSLNETEGEELLRISQTFPPPPEGEVVDFCLGDCGFDGLVCGTSRN